MEMPIVGSVLLCPPKDVLIDDGGIQSNLASNLRVKTMTAQDKTPCPYPFTCVSRCIAVTFRIRVNVRAGRVRVLP